MANNIEGQVRRAIVDARYIFPFEGVLAMTEALIIGYQVFKHAESLILGIISFVLSLFILNEFASGVSKLLGLAAAAGAGYLMMQKGAPLGMAILMGLPVAFLVYFYHYNLLTCGRD